MYFTDSGLVVIRLAEFINVLGLVFIIGLVLGMWALHYLRRRGF